MFCGTALAARIEAAEAGLISAATLGARRRGAAGLALPVAGGYGCFAEDGSPMNKVVGLGFGGVPDDWDDVERRLLAHGPVSVELSSLANPAVVALLADRGYRLAGFENVLGRELPADGSAPDVEVRPADEAEVGAWVDVVVDGFAHPDGEGVPSHEDFPRDVVDRAMRDVVAAGAAPYVALRDGEVAGGGSMRMAEGIAQLTGAATAPRHRRRGVQSALLAARLRDAADAGCDVAVVTTAPGSTSQKNVQRSGFHLLYTRAVLTR
ncbi:GNAT family N-acetyltransferase [Mycolicibacterium sediminis]|uniref:GNAT family N-acetyltransferase n=1 Tax=Mycolicibacterium sediminis TaxID=1286180 RepID=UPI0013D6A7DB|nr:GNAT family N-acetyltransferase [Mycolicibacterium sediminis]